MTLNSREGAVFVALWLIATDQRLVGHCEQNSFTSRQWCHTDVTTPIGTAYFTSATVRDVGTTFVTSSCYVIVDWRAHAAGRWSVVGGTCGLDARVAAPIGAAELATRAIAI